MITPEWVSILAPFASGAFGVGLTYGIIRQRIFELERRVDKNEAKLDEQVGEDRCDKMRDDCKKNMIELLDAKISRKL